MHHYTRLFRFGTYYFGAINGEVEVVNANNIMVAKTSNGFLHYSVEVADDLIFIHRHAYAVYSLDFPGRIIAPVLDPNFQQAVRELALNI